MRRYIIKNIDEKMYNAGSKARRDADYIAAKNGYKPVLYSSVVTADGSILLQFKMAISCIVNGLKMILSSERGSIILLQHPQFPVKSSYFLYILIRAARIVKGMRFVALVHDLDSLRGLCGKTGIFLDCSLLPSLDAVICHNRAMKRYLVSLGISPKKVIVLGLFDYLTEAGIREHDIRDGIAVAGNLDPEKCAYIDGVTLPLHLYGKGRTDFPNNAVYHGSFSPEELPGVIEGGFGLVWDGNSTDRCSGPAGEYLKYNNPHKMSLYLAAGMPVIVWKDSAVAEMVQKYGIGIAVESISEIEDAINGISDTEYREMVQNVTKFSDKVRSGHFLTRAIKIMERRLLEQ